MRAGHGPRRQRRSPRWETLHRRAAPRLRLPNRRARHGPAGPRHLRRPQAYTSNISNNRSPSCTSRSAGLRDRGGRIAQRVAQLLEDARWAEADARPKVEALAKAVLALDPGNAEAERCSTAPPAALQMTLMFCDLVGLDRDGRPARPRGHDGDPSRLHPPAPRPSSARRLHRGPAGRRAPHALRLPARARGRCPPRRAEPGSRSSGCWASSSWRCGSPCTPASSWSTPAIVGAAPNEVARCRPPRNPRGADLRTPPTRSSTGYFEVEPRGPVELRGSRADRTYACARERPARALEAARSLTPFVGRRESARPIASCGRARGRRLAAALLVSGGAGSASRGCRSRRAAIWAPSEYANARASTARRACTRSAPCSSRPAGSRTRTARDAAGQLRAASPGRDLPLLAAALPIPAELTSPPPEVDPTMLRIRACTSPPGSSPPSPSLLLVEDLHWADGRRLDLMACCSRCPAPACSSR